MFPPAYLGPQEGRPAVLTLHVPSKRDVLNSTHQLHSLTPPFMCTNSITAFIVR